MTSTSIIRRKLRYERRALTRLDYLLRPRWMDGGRRYELELRREQAAARIAAYEEALAHLMN